MEPEQFWGLIGEGTTRAERNEQLTDTVSAPYPVEEFARLVGFLPMAFGLACNGIRSRSVAIMARTVVR